MGMGAAAAADDTYRPTALARLLHSLPHLNVSLHRVNSTFAPHSEIYLEEGKSLDDIDPSCGSPCNLSFDTQGEPIYYIFVEGIHLDNWNKIVLRYFKTNVCPVLYF